MYRIAVLMSTYNGDKYLSEQIESILSQEKVEVVLFVRDDGSSDRTGDILESYSGQYSNVIVERGCNIGVGNSFMELVYKIPTNGFDYYAFADQDDIWLSQKLINAANSITHISGPALYVSNQTLVDQNLIIIKERYVTSPRIEYKQILCQNKVSGCTMVWNHPLHKLLVEYKRRPSAQLLRNRIHDVWVAMVASVVGVIVYDEQSNIMYRQHENNVIGVRKTNIIKQWINKVFNAEEQNGRSRLAREIVDRFGDCIKNEDDLNILKTYGYYQEDAKTKKRLLHDRTIVKYSGEKLNMFRLKVLLNLF